MQTDPANISHNIVSDFIICHICSSPCYDTYPFACTKSCTYHIDKHDTSSVAYDDNYESMPDIICDIEKTMIMDALRAHGTRAGAARSLGITRRIIAYKIDRYGIDD